MVYHESHEFNGVDQDEYPLTCARERGPWLKARAASDSGENHLGADR